MIIYIKLHLHYGHKFHKDGKIDQVGAKPHVPAAGSTGLQVTSSKRGI